MIDVKNLSKSFGDHLVLDDISEHIYPGRESGGHRALRLRQVHLPALPEPAGDAHRAAPSPSTGTEITDPKVDINTIRRQMGMVFQHFNLFPNMTIQKNITLAPVQHEADEARRRPTQTAMQPAGAGGPGGQGRRLSRPALRRPEAAHRHRPGPGHEARS